jgi:hypothetical protein
MGNVVDVLTEAVINRPLAEVAGFAADPDRAPSWYANIREVEWRTPKPLGVGSEIAFVAYFLGRRLAYTYRVEEWVPRSRLVMRTAHGPFPMETSYRWEELGPAETRMSLRNAGMPQGFSKLAGPFMAAAMRRENRKDLRRLKEILEAGPPT